MKELDEATSLLTQAHTLISGVPCSNNSLLVARYGVTRDLRLIAERVEKFRQLIQDHPMPPPVEEPITQQQEDEESYNKQRFAGIAATDLTPAVGSIEGAKVGTIKET